MIQEYINTLIDNLPEKIKSNKTPLYLDLVLDGGSFNGSYLVGAMLFLKEMEKRNYIKIKRISGCSIGSVVGLLYFIDALDMMSELYNISRTYFKENYNLNTIKKLKILLKDKLPKDICEQLNNNLFVTYHNIVTNEKKVRYKYKNIDDVFRSLIKSCFVPYLIDGNVTYHKKYIDGLMPYIFKIRNDRKILYLNLISYDKISQLINIKNETTNLYRVFSGILDIHYFYLKEKDTSMCSYVNDWTLRNKMFLYMKLLLEYIILAIVKIIIYCKSLFPHNFNKTKISKNILNIVKELYTSFIRNNCI